jgi:hypothetical protein
MYTSGRVLKTDADLTNAIMFTLSVIVYQNDELIDYGGLINKFTEHSVTINDYHFLRENCEFRVR